MNFIDFLWIFRKNDPTPKKKDGIVVLIKINERKLFLISRILCQIRIGVAFPLRDRAKDFIVICPVIDFNGRTLYSAAAGVFELIQPVHGRNKNSQSH
jgi:hypothetical protein